MPVLSVMSETLKPLMLLLSPENSPQKVGKPEPRTQGVQVRGEFAGIRVCHRHLSQPDVAADVASITEDQQPHAGVVTQSIWSRQITAPVTDRDS